MSSALVGLGSNIRPAYYLTQSSMKIRQKFENVVFSHVYQSAAVGMEGNDFLNACCLIHDIPDKEAFSEWLKLLEDKYGRDRTKGSWKPRTLDLDLLMFDIDILDDDLFCYAHVFVPASELIQLELPVANPNQIRRVSLCL